MDWVSVVFFVAIYDITDIKLNCEILSSGNSGPVQAGIRVQLWTFKGSTMDHSL